VKGITSISFALNIFLCILWACMIPVTLLTSLKSSVPFLIAISLYALAVSHLASAFSASARDAARSSTKE
jgi:hypothetical protein